MNAKGTCTNCKNWGNNCSCVGDQQLESMLFLRSINNAQTNNLFARRKLMKMNLVINEELERLRLKLIECKSSGIKMNAVDFSELVKGKFCVNIPEIIKPYYYTSTKRLYAITKLENKPEIVSSCPDGMHCNLFSTLISSETHVFVAGGYNGQYVCSNEVIACNLRSLQWERLGQMSQGRVLAAGLYYREFVYIIAGTNSQGNALEDMDIFNLAKNTLENVKLKTPKMKPSAFISEEKILVASPDVPSIIEIYNLQGEFIQPIQLDGFNSIIHMIANVETDMLIFSNDKCYFFKKHKEINVKSVEKLWTQHTIALLKNTVYFRDYASGLITALYIDFNESSLV